MEGTWTWMHLAYLLFAVFHPISELIPRIDLRTFLNRDYYQTGRADFPVSRKSGVGGSLFVLLILIMPVFLSWAGWWYLALGLALADLVQHADHFALGRRKTAPLFHLITIMGACYFLLRIAPDPTPNLLDPRHLGALIAGGLIITLNWRRNSRLVSPPPAATHVAATGNAGV